MKILFIVDSLVSGGKERQLIELLKKLLKKNTIKFRLIVLSRQINYDYIENINLNPMMLERECRYDPKIFYKLYKICKEFKPNIIHSWESMCSVYALPLAKLFNIKFINGMIRFAPPKLERFGKLRIRAKLTFPFSDIVLSNSYAGLKSFNVPQNKGYCIHNGFDLGRIKKIENDENIRKQFNIHTPFVVGMVARFHPRKDYPTFISAAEKILDHRNDITFLMIGKGSTLDYCKCIMNKKFKKNIKFLGKQRSIESLINIFNIGVLTSYSEGISNTIMEYMALSKPVIASDHGGNSEIVINNKTGFLIKPQNVNQLIEKIEFLIDNPDIAKRMGEVGNRRIIKDFNIEKMVGEYIDMYEKCNSNRF